MNVKSEYLWTIGLNINADKRNYKKNSNVNCMTKSSSNKSYESSKVRSKSKLSEPRLKPICNSINCSMNNF